MSTSPQVSVVIPTRNRWQLLQLTLESVLAQQGVELEVIVVDDASEDETPRALQDVADPRLKVRRCERHVDQTVARNIGISEARGSWIAFLDDDDLWAPHKLRVQLDAISRAGGDFAYAAAVGIDPDGLSEVAAPDPPPPDRLLAALFTGPAMPAGASNVIVARQLLDRVGPFDTSVTQLCDWDMWIRLAAAGKAVACAERVVAVRRHPGNRSEAEDPRRAIADYFRLRRKHSETARAAGVPFGGPWFWHWVAMSYLRRGQRFRGAAEFARSGVLHRNPRDWVGAVRALLGIIRWDPTYLAPPPSGPDLDWLNTYVRPYGKMDVGVASREIIA